MLVQCLHVLVGGATREDVNQPIPAGRRKILLVFKERRVLYAEDIRVVGLHTYHFIHKLKVVHP